MKTLLRFLLPAMVLATACNKDENPPVVQLSGNNPDTIYVKTRDVYPDAGAKAVDSEDGEVSVIVSGSVDMNAPGHYALTYTAQDKSNNVSEAVIRHVEVIAADGTFGATENCSSSGANNYTVSASMNAAYDTLTLTGFPIAGYTVHAVAQTGGYRIFPQTVSAVMDVEGTVACDGSILTATYTRTSLQGTGASETCTSVLRK